MITSKNVLKQPISKKAVKNNRLYFHFFQLIFLSGTYLFLLLNVKSLSAQAPDTLWTKTYGGVQAEDGYSVQQTTDGGFTIAHSLNGNTTEISEPIDEIEVQLAETDFIRTDQRQIVNLNHITSISKGPEDFIVLDNGLKLTIAASRKDTIISLLDHHLTNPQKIKP